MQVNVKKNLGPMGYADVKKLSKSIRVVFSDTHDAYELEDVTQLPKDFKSGEYNVSLSAQGDKIYGLRPTEGSYVLEFKEIASKNNDVPDTKIQRGGKRITLDNGQSFVTKDQIIWAVLLEVKAPGHRFDGLTIYNQLPYIFTNAPGTNSTMLSGTKKEIERLETFLRVSGMDVASVDIPYGPPSALLTWIEQYLSENKRPFLGTITDKGFLKDVSPLPEQLASVARKKAKK